MLDNWDYSYERYGPRENLFSGFANNKGADQPAHMCRLIGAFVIHAEETGLSLAVSKTLKTGFVSETYRYCFAST